MADEAINPDYAIRRIVTGHDADGKAIVTMDGPAPTQNMRGGIISTLIWGSDESPAEVWTGEDFGARENILEPPPNGSWFRIVEFPAGGPGRVHRTDTVDYVVCMSGEIDMELDDGVTIHMAAGDVMVQQGTNHSWINRGTEPCRIAFGLIDAKRQPGGSLAGPGPQALAPILPVPDGTVLPAPPLRRIVTTHDSSGNAVVMHDGLAPQRVLRTRGNVGTLLWGSDETPAEIWSAEDFGMRDNEIEPPPHGSWFRVIDYPPGLPGRMHHTESVDYVVCMAGEIDMELDDGLTVPMSAGDVMVQVATNHSWINRGTETCRIAFMLLGSKPRPQV
jgi:quercetin dioxygenase-like cupin family protein